jgi:hypothetical protein
MQMSGEQCYTLSRDNPATMWVGEEGIEVVYPSGFSVFIPRAMVVKAINLLINRRKLTVDEVHHEITNQHRTRTDKLMAVIRKLPDVTFDRIPRVLYYKIT